MAITLQLGGILISILSLTKGVAEYQLTDVFKKESNFAATAKCMLFVFPHTLVRVVTFSLTAAFLKYYAVIPATVLIVANTAIALRVAKQNKDDDGNDPLFATVAAGLCAPFVILPAYVSHHRYLRRSLLSTNILILLVLLFLLCFPLIVPSDNLADILPHIDMTSVVNMTSISFSFFTISLLHNNQLSFMY